ncbi:MAG: DMT family transporter [Acidobacteriota bacterium]
MSRPNQNLGYLLAFGAAATGAVRFNIAVWAKTRHDFDYSWFLAGALVVGLAASGAHVLRTEGAGGFRPLRGRLHHALLYGLLMGWSTLAHFLALEHLNETAMASIAQTSILVSLGLAAILLGERLTRWEWIAASVILLGMFIFRPWEAGNRTGFAILMSGVVSGSLASVGAKVWVQGTPPSVLMVWRNAIALVIVVAYALQTDRPLPDVTIATAVACAASGLLGNYLHGLFFLMALQHIAASRASLMNRVEPVVVFLVSWIFLSRVPDTEDLVSAALLTVGAFLLVYARPKARARKSQA